MGRSRKSAHIRGLCPWQLNLHPARIYDTLAEIPTTRTPCSYCKNRFLNKTRKYPNRSKRHTEEIQIQYRKRIMIELKQGPMNRFQLSSALGISISAVLTYLHDLKDVNRVEQFEMEWTSGPRATIYYRSREI